jgi:hypothetical protein
MSSELGSLPLEARSTPSQEVRIPVSGYFHTYWEVGSAISANQDSRKVLLELLMAD